MCANLLGHGQGLLVRDWLHLAGSQSIGCCAVVSQVELGADQDDGDIGGVVFNLGVPLVTISPAGSGVLVWPVVVPWLSRYQTMAG